MTTKNPARPRLKQSKPFTTPRFLWLLLLMALSPAHLFAQTNVSKVPLSSNRYLIIVETSKAMQKRSEGVLKAVEDLLSSGMRRQLRRGDTIGVWTYNDQLYAGRFALQQWTPEAHATIAGRVMAYLKEQPYEKQAHLESTLPVMDQIIKSSGLITVFLISDGEQPVRGTPFDDEINGSYKLWKAEQQKARMPFVTLLRAAKGTITHHSVTSAPWPVEMPALPPPPIPVVVTPTNSAPAKTNPVPNLIVSGKKSKPPEPVKPIETVVPGADPLVSAQPLKENTTTPAPAPTSSPTQPSTEPVGQPVLTTAPSTAAPPLITKDTNSEKASAALVKEDPQPAPVTSVPKSNQETPIAIEKPAPAQAQPSARGDASPANPRDSASGEVAALAPEGLFLSQKTIILAGLAVAAIVIVLGLLTFRRTRPGSHSSLITRSFDRENK